ncbi:MAG: hypothetical protein HY040_15015 [Planctomycetes bacterium]|nr:hypothetical protein [Planctomycetota bacterium]
MLHGEPIANEPAIHLSDNEVCRWLEKQGFQKEAPTPKYIRFRKEDLEVGTSSKIDDLIGLQLTMQLAKTSFARRRWKWWQEAVDLMCDTWNLTPFDPEQRRKVRKEDFLRLLTETLSWKEFSTNFGWPELSSAQVPGVTSPQPTPQPQ